MKIRIAYITHIRTGLLLLLFLFMIPFDMASGVFPDEHNNKLLLSDPSAIMDVPSNDLPCQAEELEVNEICSFSVYNNTDAGDSGIPDPGCGNYSGGDVWFYVLVPSTGRLLVQTDTEAELQFPDNNGWMYHAGMAVYSGACSSLSLIGCYEDNSAYHPRMPEAQLEGYTPGDTIWIRIWENSNNDNGMFDICCTELPPICPAQYEVSGGGGCPGDTGYFIQLSGSQYGIEYTLLLNDTIRLDTLAGSNDILTWSPVLTPGVYKVEGRNPVEDCSVIMNDSAFVVNTDPILITLDQVNHLTSYEAQNGSIEVTVTGGVEPYVYFLLGSDGFTSTNEDPFGLSVGFYDLMVTDDNSCKDSLTGIMVSVLDEGEELFIPEGFSPNGDGFNDLFVILGIGNYPENELVVFNRLGIEVYKALNYQNDWDGTPEKGGVIGGILPEGTYYYIFTYGSKMVKKGYLYLNRE